MAACPAPSPDGRWIAYLGFEDQGLFHQQPHLWLMRADGSEARRLLDIDRDLFTPTWDAASERVYFSYFDAGVDRIGCVDLQGHWQEVVADIGGTAGPNINISGTHFSLGPDFIVTTTSSATRPPQVGRADLHQVADGHDAHRSSTLRELTELNRAGSSLQARPQ